MKWTVVLSKQAGKDIEIVENARVVPGGDPAREGLAGSTTEVSMTKTLIAVIALVIGLAGQVGDLFASEFKRSAGIKDSGSLLPGHGGFLDRLDALLFASPLAYLLKVSIF